MHSLVLRSSGILLAAITLTPHAIYSQDVASVAKGDRVRFSDMREKGVIPAVYLGVANDSLSLRLLRDNSVLFVPRASISSFEVRTGRHRSPAAGALTGGIAGSLIGAIGGSFSGHRDGVCQCLSRRNNMSTGAFYGGVLGLVAGAFIGMPRDDWQTAAVPTSVGPVALSAQPRVRLQYIAAGNNATSVGTLLLVSSDSVVLRDARTGELTTVPRYAIRSSELTAGRHRHIGLGFVLGLIGGAALGAGIGAASTGPRSIYDDGTKQAFSILGGGLFGAVVGSVGGAVIGSHVYSEDWSDYPLPASQPPGRGARQH